MVILSWILVDESLGLWWNIATRYVIKKDIYRAPNVLFSNFIIDKPCRIAYRLSYHSINCITSMSIWQDAIFDWSPCVQQLSHHGSQLGYFVIIIVGPSSTTHHPPPLVGSVRGYLHSSAFFKSATNNSIILLNMESNFCIYLIFLSCASCNRVDGYIQRKAWSRDEKT